MKLFFVLSLAFIGLSASAQPSLTLVKQRPPELDLSNYKQIAVGDIVGPLGSKTEQSLDLTDALTAKLFKANTMEILDRNALDNILGSQHTRDLQVIDEQTKQLLNKKLSNALLISGRIQSQKLEQKLIYADQGIVVNGCNRTYYYQVKGDVTIQLKILDVKTGKMIYSDAVITPVDKRTKEECQVPNKLDIGEITRASIKDLSEAIAKLVVPYGVSTVLQLGEPGLFESPFEQLKEAVSYLQINNTDAGLAILKNYTESKEVKDKVKDNAWYNYGLGLVYAGKNEEAKKALQMSASLNSANLPVATQLIQLIDKEEEVSRKMEAMALAREKSGQAAAQQNKDADKPAKTTKPASKTKVKS